MTKEFLFLLIGSSLASFSTRYLPFVFLTKKELSNEFKEWMNFVPVTVFAALVASDIFFVDNRLTLNILTNRLLIPSVIVLIASIKYKSMIISILVGITSLFLIQLI